MGVMLRKKIYTNYNNHTTTEYPVARLIVKIKINKYKKYLDHVFLIFLNWYCNNIVDFKIYISGSIYNGLY